MSYHSPPPAFHDDLLERIEAFLKETGMSESYFGRRLSNGQLLPRLRAAKAAGRSWRGSAEVRHRIDAFMTAHRAEMEKSKQ